MHNKWPDDSKFSRSTYSEIISKVKSEMSLKSIKFAINNEILVIY